ncbi:MAG: putative RNA methyltransferase [Streptosporangiaceae bacterium]
MLDDVVGWLRCPHCRRHLARAGGSMRCPAGHSFDIARHGYVSLLQARPVGGRGDTAAMVRARTAFLATGHFASIAAEVADAADAVTATMSHHPGPGCVVDIGAGTGYYLAAVLDRVPGAAGLALDMSKHALRQAARAHPRAGAVGCDAWRRLPVADGVADIVLDVFAPRHGAEMRRIVRADGRLLVVTPAAEHLAELIGPLRLLGVDERKRERLDDKLGPYFDLESESHHRGVMTLSHCDVAALAAMGPSAWHADEGSMPDRVASLPDRVSVTRAVTLTVLRPRL